jgi:hypothetical protein
MEVNMVETAMVLFRSTIIFIYGAGISRLLAGIKRSRKGDLTIILFSISMLLVQLFCWWMFGLQFTMKLYPFIIHIPMILLLTLYFKRPLLISATSVLIAYLCCQIPNWSSTVASAISGNIYVGYVVYFIFLCVSYYFIYKYVAASVRQLIESSKRSCLIFAALPLLYYLFDYTTTIYTDLLYSGAREAVQFAPSVMCFFYLVFVLLYSNELQKQNAAQLERDIYASQFQQARRELETMREMQKNTVIYRHDMRHHLSLISSFAKEGNLKKIRDYLSNTAAAIDALTPKHYCENETVNLILSSFENKAKKMLVTLQADVTLPEKLDVNDTELCALLSNALENAITAAAQAGDDKLRKVYIKAIVSDNKLVISTENAYVSEIIMDGELQKSGSGEEGHGYGIKSIVAIVERNGGLYSIETEGGVFVLQLLLPLDKEASVHK